MPVFVQLPWRQTAATALIDEERTSRRTAMTPPRGGRGLATVVGLALAIGTTCACSSARPGPSVASLPGRSAASPSAGTTLTQAQEYQRLVTFAACMRNHGIDVPDPQPGRFQIPVATDPATAAAMRACQRWLPSLDTGTPSGPNGNLAAELPQLIAYARCMRAHDIAMLDPNSFGALNLGAVPGITNDFGRYSPQFRAADASCRHLLPAGVHDDGTGP
jgi:hypothetical protein